MGKYTAGTGDVAEKASGRGQLLKSRDEWKVEVKALLLLPSTRLSGCVCTHATVGGSKCTQICFFGTLFW